MSEYKIDTKIPIPSIRNKNGRYPFDTLKVGDSFFVPAEGANVVAVRSAAYMYAKSHLDYKVTARLVEEDGVKGVRIWRVAKEEKQG